MGETVGGPDRETSSSERQQQKGWGGELSIRRHKLMWGNIPGGWNELILDWQLSRRSGSPDAQQKSRHSHMIHVGRRSLQPRKWFEFLASRHCLGPWCPLGDAAQTRDFVGGGGGGDAHLAVDWHVQLLAWAQFNPAVFTDGFSLFLLGCHVKTQAASSNVYFCLPGMKAVWPL